MGAVVPALKCPAVLVVPVTCRVVPTTRLPLVSVTLSVVPLPKVILVLSAVPPKRINAMSVLSTRLRISHCAVSQFVPVLALRIRVIRLSAFAEVFVQAVCTSSLPDVPPRAPLLVAIVLDCVRTVDVNATSVRPAVLIGVSAVTC